MKATKVKIADKATDVLKAELGALESTYNGATIEFRNSKGIDCTCPANLIDRLGNYAGPADDKEAKQAYLNVYFRSTHEARKGAEAGGSVRLSVGESFKGVRVTSTVKGLDAAKAKVSHQYAVAQKLAREIHAIRVELEARAQVEREAAEIESKAKADADVMVALMG